MQLSKLNMALCIACAACMAGCMGTINKPADDQWQSLFNGRDLTGWTASEKEGCFSVENGTIKVSDGRSHLFYTGPVENADFTDFEFSALVMTTPGSNSGIYFHTEFQEEGWPKKGRESQVNISHKDPQKSGGLYNAAKVNAARLSEVSARDNRWYTHHITVKGKHVEVKINGQTVVDYTEAEDLNSKNSPGKGLSRGTFALQGHDPKSTVYFKDIMVKPLK
jgi:hypothetical protein